MYDYLFDYLQIINVLYVFRTLYNMICSIFSLLASLFILLGVSLCVCPTRTICDRIGSFCCDRFGMPPFQKRLSGMLYGNQYTDG